nr:putative ribonuclease H-like domain-containing protein [Tanacetum cinerariifolium]
MPTSPVHDRYKSGEGYHAVPLPIQELLCLLSPICQIGLLPLSLNGLLVAKIHSNIAAAFEVKEPKSAVHVSPNSCEKTKKHDDKTKREAKGKSHVAFTPVTVIGPNSTNSTNTFSGAGPFNNPISLNFKLGGKSSFVNPSQYPDDPDMPALEDITYSDDEEDVGAEADFSNLETNITEMGHFAGLFIWEREEVMGAYCARLRWKSASTPIDTEKPLLKDPDGEDVDVHTYRSIIGSLMYLTSSRLDFMFHVCAYSCFQVTLKASHLHAVKRSFRYLKGKPHWGLWYPKDSPFNLVAFLIVTM